MTKSPRPEFRINIFLTSVKPRWYAYQIYRDRDHALLAGSECRSHRAAMKEAQSRLRQLEQGIAA